VLQNYPSFIPKESQPNLSRRWLCAEFFQFWWGGMAPFLAHFLGFQLVVMDPGFISRNDYSQKAITFCFKAFQKFLAGINTSFFQFCSQLAWHLPCRHFRELQSIVDDMVCWSMTHIQMCGYFIHCYAVMFLHDGFNCRYGLWCHYSVCLTRSRRVC